ncbi:MAG: hypothetical protein M3P08_04390 [Thermoproteota archaeon]|nr:hypothetical protein [Thermoproteota archaeon]
MTLLAYGAVELTYAKAQIQANTFTPQTKTVMGGKLYTTPLFGGASIIFPLGWNGTEVSANTGVRVVLFPTNFIPQRGVAPSNISSIEGATMALTILNKTDSINVTGDVNKTTLSRFVGPLSDTSPGFQKPDCKISQQSNSTFLNGKSFKEWVSTCRLTISTIRSNLTSASSSSASTSTFLINAKIKSYAYVTPQSISYLLVLSATSPSRFEKFISAFDASAKTFKIGAGRL